MGSSPPITARAQAASIAAQDLPIRFPDSRRRLDGRLSVSEASDLLRRIGEFHFLLMRSIAGWIIRIPEFEAKVEQAHHLYLHAEVCERIHRRLGELRVSRKRLAVPLAAELRPIATVLSNAGSVGQFLELQALVLEELVEGHAAYLRLSDSLLDRPSGLILRRFAPELRDNQEWLASVAPQYRTRESSANTAAMAPVKTAEALKAYLAAIGGVTGRSARDGARADALVERLGERKPAPRELACRRDQRFTTFRDTRDYGRALDALETLDSQLLEEIFELVCVQRDEIDAIETFANVLHDLEDPQFELCFALARFIEDEARHAEAGHQAIETGFRVDPFSVPCSIIGINVRSPMPPLQAFAQISIFGELNIVGRLRDLAEKAASGSEPFFARFFDFIHADELIHLRVGRDWLKRLHPDHDLDGLEEETRLAAAKRLHEEGVMDEDYACTLTRSEIGRLIGE